MNGLENMTDKILRDAREAADRLKKETDLKVEQLLLDRQAEADALKKEIASAAEEEARMTVSRARSQAALNERNELLRAKREVIDSVFQTACDLIADLPKDEYVDFLARLVARYQTGPAEIILNRRDTERLGADLIKKVLLNKIKKIDVSMVKLSKTPGSFKGGLILRQGDIDTNCTLEVLCEGLRHELEPQVIAQLQF